MKGIYKTKLFTIFLLIICAFFLVCTDVHAEEGSVAVTGSFSTYKYQIVQGETVESPLVNVIFINHYSNTIKLQIMQDTPEGVDIKLDDEYVTLEPNSMLDIPIVISVSDDAIPGEYDIAVQAKLIGETIEGKINVSSKFSLKTKLTVFGEAADLNINVVDIAGKPIPAIMNLYQITDQSKTPLAYSEKGTIVERVIPGEYEVIAFWNDFQLVRHQFSVVADQQYTKTLIAETVQLYAFTVSPVFVENRENELATANLHFILHNIYEEINDCRVVMLVYKNGELAEERDIFSYDSLEVNRHELGLHYVPSQGWDKAEYTFELQFYVDEKDENGNVLNSTLYASSMPAVLDVSSGIAFRNISKLIDVRIFLYILLIAILIGLYFLIKYLLNRKAPAADVPPAPVNPAPASKPIAKRNCPDCNGKGTIVCPVCEGKGTTMYGSIAEECIYCNGVGEVMCANCINPKHLAVCPKCNGNGHTMFGEDKVDCTFCNGLGHVVPRQYAKYIDGVKLKLGKKKD